MIQTALVLAGGRGTRLAGVVPDDSKPMAPINGRPFLEYVLLHLARSGVAGAVICTGYRADLIMDHFGDGERVGLSLTYSHEQEPRGTAGALHDALPLATGSPVLAVNGDSFLGADLRMLADFHAAHDARVTLALTAVDDAARFGRVAVDAGGRIAGFTEKDGVAGRPGLVNAGVYVLDAAALTDLPGTGAISLERDLLPKLIGHGLYGLALDGFFVDIGLPADYATLRADPSRLLESVA